MNITYASPLTDLHRWYNLNKRELPWRSTKDPYFIWISEVILQQTRVVQGLPYYYKFIELFPTVADLAAATEQEVLHCWQGLGYYSRARNMHATAKMVMERFGGNFPSSYNDLIALKGIGPYTAAAVASFAANENVAVVDGNVMRVLARWQNIHSDIALEKTKKEFQTIADNLLPKGKSAVHNQAMMELGALICTPQSPKCAQCPVAYECKALEMSTINVLPVKSKKVKPRERFFNYIVFRSRQKYWMKERDKDDIWAGLWDFYLLETDKEVESLDELLLEKEIVQEVSNVSVSALQKHQLTHQTLRVKYFVMNVSEKITSALKDKNLVLLDTIEISSKPKPILINKFFSEHNLYKFDP